MATTFNRIVLPTRPQADTTAAIFILKTFGQEKFSGIANAEVIVMPLLPEGATEELFEEQGVILIDIGGGKFDHHKKDEKTTAALLVAEYLGVKEQPALAKLLEYAYRDDVYGKGTLSEDPLDRAFGLSGLLSTMNKHHVENPNFVVNAALPFFASHYAEEKQRIEELPKEFESLRREGKTFETTVRQGDKNLHVVRVSSDSASLPGYLRSQLGGRFDVVVQCRSTGHVNILTRPTKKVRLPLLAEVIRIEEAAKSGIELDLTERELQAPGTLEKIPEWYFDPATNSILNGGIRSGTVPPTRLTFEELDALVVRGLSERIPSF